MPDTTRHGSRRRRWVNSCASFSTNRAPASALVLSQYEVNRSRYAMRGLHCESCNYNAEPQAERNRFYEKGTIFGSRCRCRDDCGSDGRARRRGSIVGDHSESRRVDSQTGEEVGPAEQLQACYEAGPTGYVLYWQLTALGVKCEVVAPSLVPVKAGDRVKTDRRGALKLARNYRAGEVTAVWGPDAAHEALRDLVRAREAAKKDQLRARHRLSKFLLRHGRRPPAGVHSWTMKYLQWVRREVHFEQRAQEATLLDYLHEVERAAARIAPLDGALTEAVKCAPPQMRAVIEALQGLRGIAHVAAVTVVAELGELSRFA